MVKRRQVAAFLLAGGASSRMGRDKGLLEFAGVPLVVHTAQLLAPLVSRITVVGAARDYAGLGVRTIQDGSSGREGAKKIRCGPLAGIAAALADTRSPWNLILACDLPYLTAAWLGWLLDRALRSPAQALVPRTERGLEPLAAVYRRECGPPVAAALARGERKVTNALAELRVEVVEESDWRRLDASALLLKNMNEPGDYEEARKWWNNERPREGKRLKRDRTGRTLTETGGAGTWRRSSRA